jgi:hypothetical protein
MVGVRMLIRAQSRVANLAALIARQKLHLTQCPTDASGGRRGLALGEINALQLPLLGRPLVKAELCLWIAQSLINCRSPMADGQTPLDPGAHVTA